MAHNITKTDGLVLAGQSAWHGLGIVLPEAPTVDQALDLAGLRWRIEQKPLYIDSPIGPIEVPTHVANVRSDTRDILGVVTKGYTPVDNEVTGGLLLAAAKDGAMPKIETAGSLSGGRDVFFTSNLREFGLGVGRADVSRIYAVFSNNHAGQRAFRVYTTSVRVVCANTHVASGVDDLSKGLALRHSSGIVGRVDEIRKSLERSNKIADEMVRQAEALSNRPMTSADVQAFFMDVYQSLYGTLTVSDAELARERRRKAVKVVSAWVEAMDSPKQEVGGLQGTAWAAVNSVTDWLQHERPVRKLKGETLAQARVRSSMFGSTAAQTRTVHDLALALV